MTVDPDAGSESSGSDVDAPASVSLDSLIELDDLGLSEADLLDEGPSDRMYIRAFGDRAYYEERVRTSYESSDMSTFGEDGMQADVDAIMGGLNRDCWRDPPPFPVELGHTTIFLDDGIVTAAIHVYESEDVAMAALTAMSEPREASDADDILCDMARKKYTTSADCDPGGAVGEDCREVWTQETVVTDECVGCTEEESSWALRDSVFVSRVGHIIVSGTSLSSHVSSEQVFRAAFERMVQMSEG